MKTTIEQFRKSIKEDYSNYWKLKKICDSYDIENGTSLFIVFEDNQVMDYDVLEDYTKCMNQDYQMGEISDDDFTDFKELVEQLGKHDHYFMNFHGEISNIDDLDIDALIDDLIDRVKIGKLKG